MRGHVEHKLEIAMPEFNVVFEWHGGAYIDVCKMGRPRKAFEVINVWDDDTNKPGIPFTIPALRKEAREWIAENKDNLPEYFRYI